MTLRFVSVGAAVGEVDAQQAILASGCGGKLKVIASIEEPQVSAKIFSHLSRGRSSVEGSNARFAQRWIVGFRARDVAQALDGAPWLLEYTASGGLNRLTPK